MELTLVIDHSMAELFVGDSVVMTERVYPQRADSTIARLNAAGRGTTVRSFDVWELSLAPHDGRATQAIVAAATPDEAVKPERPGEIVVPLA
jgi:hypothetical protein